MRINQMNYANYTQMMKTFSQLGGKNRQPANLLSRFADKNLASVLQNKNMDNHDDMLNSQGVAGMYIGGKDPSEYQKIIEISQQGKQKLFDMVKSEFMKNNGVLNGDTTRKSEVYAEYQKSIPKEDRLKATYTLEQLEREYRTALIGAVKKENPNWRVGGSFNSDALSQVTRQSISGSVDKQSNKNVNYHV